MTGTPYGRASGHECEIKLEGPAEILRSLKTHPAFANADVKSRAVNLRAIYFDTAMNDLARNGMSLRIRTAGRRRTMTAKWISEGQGVFSRGEAEAPAPDDQIDLTRLPADAAARIAQVANGAPLLPVFQTHVRRKLMKLADADTLIEIAVDEGQLMAGAISAPIAEVEIELKSGAQASLYALALQLVDAGLRLAPATKSARGYLLASQELPHDVRAAPIVLPPDATMQEALIAMIESSLTHFMANWPAFLVSNLPEGIHQMRVALRRLRAGLRMFERAMPDAGLQPYRDAARNIAAGLGRARELDAFIDLVESGPLTQFGADASFDALLAQARKDRAKAYDDARAIVSSAQSSRFVLELQACCAQRGWRKALAPDELAMLSQLAQTFAVKALDDLDRRAIKRGKKLRSLKPDDRHEWRIALKNMRYGADFLGILFNDQRAIKRFAKSAAALQDDLGVYNDSISACDIAIALHGEAAPQAAHAAGLVEGWCARGAHASDNHLREAFKTFRKAKRFWR